jgi:hypothetical protein
MNDMEYITLNFESDTPCSVRNLDDLDSLVLSVGNQESQAHPRHIFSSHDSNESDQLSSERVYWVLYGNYDFTSLKATVERMHEHSKLVIVTGIDEAGFAISNPQEQELLKEWLLEERVELIFCSSAIRCAEYVAASMDRLAYNGWKPLLDDYHMNHQADVLSDFYVTLGKKLNRDILRDNTFDRNLKIYFENSLVNLPMALSESKLPLPVQMYDQRPALLVSPGPSLNKQLETLKKYQHVYTIICASAAYPNLIEAGIDPDYVVSIDVTNAPVLRSGSQAKLVTDIGCDPKTVWSSPERTILNSHAPVLADLLNRLGAEVDYLATGGSVATTAFRFAQKIGSKIIVMIGQDLAYGEDGKLRADGYAFDRASAESARKTVFTIPGYYGGKVGTDNALLHYKTWFENAISTTQEHVIFNSTEGGAYIDGATHIPFEEISKEIESFGLQSAPWNLPALENPTVDQIANLIDGLDALSTLVTCYQDLSKTGLELIDGHEKNEDSVDFSEIDTITEALAEFPDYVKFCIDVYAGESMRNVQRFMSRKIGEVSSSDDLVNFYSEIFRVSSAAAEKALEFINKTMPLYESFVSNPDLLANDFASEFVRNSSRLSQ